MPHIREIRTIRGAIERTYFVVYEDAPEREEAVRFFKNRKATLFPTMRIPTEVAALPINEANQYLRKHPISEEWEGLAFNSTHEIKDEDLFRLQFVPELTRLQIGSSRITDSGIKHLLYLQHLEVLLIYSDKVTDACLEIIRNLPLLRMIDMRGSSNVTRDAFNATMAAFARPPRSWAPLRLSPHHLNLYARWLHPLPQK